MSVGDGIFGAALILGFVALYLGTKDRWRWKRIMGGLLASVLGLSFAVGLWVGWLKWSESRPRVATGMWGVYLGAKQSDVLFTKGEPTTRVSDERWEYIAGPEGSEYAVIISFVGRQVTEVLSLGNRLYMPTPDGVSGYESIQQLLARYGEPQETGLSADGLVRTYRFREHNLLVSFDKGGMIGVGVVAPAAKTRVYGQRIDNSMGASAPASNNVDGR